ncbi:uncharacterized protein LOC132700728 isoform X2 [Cylas formicarius]|uniref:uncharacterized protein LOC132700728 isoform X2 n=1 Tax=Cylas formicarius TaxID=197179 RepID=UPI002958D887|nr:uncharacterized protein LOC132700728 isoform X2 [Cylas formicarius]
MDMENSDEKSHCDYISAVSPPEHQLWVNLTSTGAINVFSQLPSLLQTYLLEVVDEMENEFFDLILPSDNAWQTKIYYKLVEKQRLADSAQNGMIAGSMVQEHQGKTFLEWSLLQKRKTSCTAEVEIREKRVRPCNYLAPITWTVRDIAKAGGLLSSPPQAVTFEDEQEMRRVYTLIYDVFRYKNILIQALNDVCFFQIFRELDCTAPHVWLLFYDLYHRSFRKRETSIAPLATELFEAAGLSHAENALWSQKVKLAAAVSRLRIKHNALSLSDLLPDHLRDEKVTELANSKPVSCWVNCLKVGDRKTLCENIAQTLNLTMVDSVEHLNANNFKWDKHCPQIITFHATMRGELARSRFIRDHLLIVQDRSFCRGAATFGKILLDLGLTGSVIQTHVNSPRTTAYLATLLIQNQRINRLIAFSAGKRKNEYEAYFMDLGVNNITIFADRLIDLPQDANYMEEVIAVFATPPNSYSAVTDPIDLVCSRGGDLSMLEILTEYEETKEAKERVINILEEQRKTLRFAMSRPQIQFVLYETHSEIDAENGEMVNRAIREVNRLARVQHATLQGTAISCETTIDEPTGKEINNNDKANKNGADRDDETIKHVNPESQLTQDTKQKLLDSLKMPDSDLFEQPEVPSLCSGENSCINFKKEGCYLALLQRKEVIRLDNKYMIKMAENRGLFGSNTTTSTSKSKTRRVSRKKLEKESKSKPSKKRTEIEIDRITAPTHTFLCHTKRTHEINECRRCNLEEETKLRSSRYKRWWLETTRHILDLKKCLVKQKIMSSEKIRQVTQKNILNSFVVPTNNVDEIALEMNNASRFPVFPKLRLNRENNCVKIRVPVTVVDLDFPHYVLF